MEIKRVTYREGYNAMYEEMVNHWKEVPFGDFEDLTLNLDHERYMGAEDEGYASNYMAYNDEGVPVAYMSVLASSMQQHMHVTQAVADSFYVNPDYRRTGIFAKLIAFVEQDLKDHGIRFFTLGHNPNTKEDVEGFLKHIGYQKTEVLYTKEL